ncbi:MAG: NGG1p interacting factor NIF3 [Bacteroidetes bacterium]|nr:MAG: NGG1p interacting factor NIF3 [Bacteroidota bacterium]
MYLLVVYVPEENLENVKSAVFNAGGGKIDHYSHCSWQVLGRGQFKPEAGSSPFLGEVNKLERVDEYRLELVCQDSNIKKVVQAMIDAHPYETPAYHFVKVSTLDDLN